MSEPIARIHTDGAARGNPGPAAWAYLIECPGHQPIEAAEKFGDATNNVAEYTALIQALKRALELGIRRAEVFSDSELMVKQMNGEYAVKNADLRDLYEQAQELRRHFSSVTIRHVRRAENKRTVLLCNAVLDGRPPSVAGTRSAKATVARRPDVDSDAIACLRSAAQAWAATSGRNPTPELVWDQLWSILAEAGMLKKKC